MKGRMYRSNVEVKKKQNIAAAKNMDKTLSSSFKEFKPPLRRRKAMIIGATSKPIVNHGLVPRHLIIKNSTMENGLEI